MSKRSNGRNIDLRGRGFGRRLQEMRRAKFLSKEELANAAGIHPRSVSDLEADKRPRSQENTLLSLARVFEVTLDELLGAPPEQASNGRGRHNRFGLAAITAASVLAVALVIAGVLWHRACERADWALEKGQLVVSDEILGTKLWEIRQEPKTVQACIVSPWRSDELIVGLNRMAPGGGAVMCLKRSDGDTVWTLKPDLPALAAAFGADLVMSADFGCSSLSAADLDGDAVPEIVVGFGHGKYFPYAVCVVRSDGTLRAQYSHRGHLTGIKIADIDSDGRDEIVCAGTNNSRAYLGATIVLLDGEHCGGVSVDPLCCPGEQSVADSSLVRLILPNYPDPYLQLMNGRQLGASEMQVVEMGERNVHISALVRSDTYSDKISVFVDSDLRPVRAHPDDSFLPTIATWPDSLANGTGPGDTVWLAKWLAGYIRLESGQPVR